MKEPLKGRKNNGGEKLYEEENIIVSVFVWFGLAVPFASAGRSV